MLDHEGEDLAGDAERGETGGNAERAIELLQRRGEVDSLWQAEGGGEPRDLSGTATWLKRTTGGIRMAFSVP